VTEQGLTRALPGKFVLAVTVGGVIGLGILRGPGEIAEVNPDPFLYLALVIGVLILRKREPDSERPYRAWGHPYSTIVCLVGWTLITSFQAFAERETAVYALAMVAVSWPVYRYLVRK
jgi:amino acid transporter